MSWENNIRNRFEGAEYQPSEDVWLRIQRQVAPPPARTRPLYGSYAIAATVALLLAAGGWLWWTPQPPSGPTPNAAPLAVVAPAGTGPADEVAMPTPAPQPNEAIFMAQQPEKVMLPGKVYVIDPPSVPNEPATHVAAQALPQLAQLSPMPRTPLKASTLHISPMPELAASPFPQPQAQWAMLEAPLPQDLKPARGSRWRAHLSGMPYQMGGFPRQSLAAGNIEALTLHPSDTIYSYQMPRGGMAWQTSLSYQLAKHWAVETGVQVMHTLASAPIGIQYLVVVPSDTVPTTSLASAGNSFFNNKAQEDNLIANTVDAHEEVFSAQHTGLRFPVLLTLTQGHGRHQVAVSAGLAGLVNFSQRIPMRRGDLEAVARMRYEYAITPGLSLHTALQVATPTPSRQDVFTPIHVGLQTGVSFRLPS